MTLIIAKIVNKPVASNCYVIYADGNNSCMIIDPGTENNQDLIDFLKHKKIFPEYVILTHEHFDHVIGLDNLKKIYQFKSISCDVCSLNIQNSKKNLSLFYNQIGIELNPVDITFDENEFSFVWMSIEIKLFKLPGHSKGSIGMLLKPSTLFLGDTLLENMNTIIKLPGGSKADLVNTFNYLKLNFTDKDYLVYPGHGNPFKLNENFIYK
jgi:glyoxylase-like metal-dependent hydrolase (beta-lactamase superfamily II)